MMNFVGASLKMQKMALFYRAHKSYYIDMNNVKKYSEKNIVDKPWAIEKS